MGEMDFVVIKCMTIVQRTVVARLCINLVVLLLAVLGRRESSTCGRRLEAMNQRRRYSARRPWPSVRIVVDVSVVAEK